MNSKKLSAFAGMATLNRGSAEIICSAFTMPQSKFNDAESTMFKAPIPCIIVVAAVAADAVTAATAAYAPALPDSCGGKFADLKVSFITNLLPACQNSFATAVTMTLSGQLLPFDDTYTGSLNAN
jgi:hypothetical protein